MKRRIGPSFALSLALLPACPPLPPELVTCEEEDACETTLVGASSEGATPTTGDDINTVTGDAGDASSGDVPPDAETGVETIGSTGQAEEAPLIITRVVVPDYTDKNALLQVSVTAEHAAGVHMQLDSGEMVELALVRPGEFGGQIEAFTGLDNGEHTAQLTPWRDAIVGETVGVDYVIALPPPGFEVGWELEDLNGNVAAIGVLPDGRPVEFGTFQEMGSPRCYLRLRERSGAAVALVKVLEGAYCSAIDMTIDRDSGMMHVLVERMKGDDVVWWAGEAAGWGAGVKNIGVGELGDTALALASRPGLVAVCGAKPVATVDERDAMAVLLRAGEAAEEVRFDYQLSDNPQLWHTYAETARDCTFADETLVLVGEAWGKHDKGGMSPKRDRLMVIEYDVDGVVEPAWSVAGPGPGVQSRGLAIDIDDEGRYQLAGYTCLDDCKPEGDVRIYAPGGKLVGQTSLGPLGSPWFGPHDIAWSPAGYAVVALGEMQGQSFVFKVQAVAPGVPAPLWTFTPKDKQGAQLARAVAIGPLGEVYAGGVGAGDQPVFVVIGS